MEAFPSRPNGEPDDVPVGELVKSRGNPEQGEPSPIPIGIENMLNRTFLLREETDGSRHRTQITAVVEEFNGQLDFLTHSVSSSRQRLVGAILKNLLNIMILWR